MIIHELTRAECLEVLHRVTVARLACVRDSQPYIVPVSFYFNHADMSLYSFSTLGQKIRWMRENPRVCVELDEIIDRLQWTTVVINGVYEEIRNAPDAARVQERALKLFESQPNWWLPGTATLPKEPAHDTPVVYRIRVANMSGRRTSRRATDTASSAP